LSLPTTHAPGDTAPGCADAIAGSGDITPGFLALHGNRTEDLALTVIDWLRQRPLGPLEEEVVLVQSNGMAEWFKMELARHLGICAAVRVELPGRFVWRTCRQVLGPRTVPAESPLDKLPLTWRLMAVLPRVVDQPVYAPLRGYLRADEPERTLQLAARLADLYDQYQNHRTDWLTDWAAGHDQLRRAEGPPQPLAADQAWQATLWRAVLATLDEGQRAVTRPALHRRVLAQLAQPAAHRPPVARRVVVFGMSHLPGATLELLAGLSAHSQVLLAVPNPCRHHWGDIMEGRELLRSTRRRHGPRAGADGIALDLATVDLADMHQHAHPLLAAWGKQGRDFVRLLDAFDDAQAQQERLGLPRIDLFDETTEQPDTPLLQRVQQRIRDLEPLHGGAPAWPVRADDDSIVFHSAHSPVRELEVLHDHMLRWLADAQDSSAPLHPRDMVVMVPDIEAVAPAIRAVFGQYPRHSARHIPFDIADLGAPSGSPVIQALEWLLRLGRERCRLADLCNLLEVPAVAARFGLDAERLPLLTEWMHGAGLRWGLDAAHRQQLGLGACGGHNSTWFALQRLLLGYATGGYAREAGFQPEADPAAWAGGEPVEPFADMGGLDAELAGGLAHLVRALTDWWALSAQDAAPATWAERGRALLQACFASTDDADTGALTALADALAAWTHACDQAGFDQAVDVATFAQAWLQALEQPSLARRFRAGGVTFCTLMPMRAIPFEVVCLLGMNDGDYPRRGLHSDFDLMALPGQARPGDRSRRDDDRQLMLEALLCARRRLYVGWRGRSVRDHTGQPPSVLVAQLRDYLSAVWGPEVVAERTTEHPLQPFSRRYFEEGSPWHTQAREWQGLHAATRPLADAGGLPAWSPGADAPLTLQRLGQFLRNPVKAFFRARLGVVFPEGDTALDGDEPFDLAGLDRHGVVRRLVEAWPPASEASGVAAQLPAAVARLRRSGELPLAGLGDLTAAHLLHTLQGMAHDWATAGADCPGPQPRLALELSHGEVSLRDWLEPLGGGPTWLHLTPSRLTDGKGQLRADTLLLPWLHLLVAAACGHPVQGRVVGQGGAVWLAAMPQAEALAQCQRLLDLWHQGMQSPLPLPLRTALAHARQVVRDSSPATGAASAAASGPAGPPPEQVYEGGFRLQAEADDPCLARTYPDFEQLQADGRFAELAVAAYGPFWEWLGQCQYRPSAVRPSASPQAIPAAAAEPHAAKIPTPTSAP
jgi:exodeoxyribonuclease V gamma subunit